MSLGRLAVPALLALALASFAAGTLRASAGHLYPVYDEVDYLQLTRRAVREGGLVANVRCYLEGRCREDNRPPIYQFLLTTGVDDAPASFARAKLYNLGVAALLMALVYLVVRRMFSARVAAGAVVVLCLMPVLSDLGQRILHDVLYTLVTFAAVYAIGSWQERGAAAWLGAGALVGVAFLTKGSGHLLLVPLVAASFYRHRAALLRRPILYAAAVGFLAVSFFLLWRNLRLWHDPFHNVNAGEVWMDRWRDTFVMRRLPEHARLGLGWYLRGHSIIDLVVKLGKGFGETVGVYVYAAGVGPASPVSRVVTGAALVVLGALGLRRRFREGHRDEVVAVTFTLAIFCAALSLASSGAPEPQVRYMFPYVVLIIPHAVYEAMEGIAPRVRAWVERRRPGLPARAAPFAFGLLAGVFAVRLALAAPSAWRDPRGLYAIDPRWNETSVWLSQRLRPGERFALPYMSKYSTWDVPRPDLDPRWPFWFGVSAADLLRYMAEDGTRYVLVDRADGGYRDYADKLSAAADAHGPLAFLGWPRCFADADRPSRFLIYCRPSAAAP
jgi:4-amino-4-deoxy-L-arabinose transferase-like glycosyltransferase